MISVSRLFFPIITFLLVLTAGGLHPIIFGGAKFYIITTVFIFILIIGVHSYDKKSLYTFLKILPVSIVLLCLLQFINGILLFDIEFVNLIFRLGVALCVLLLYQLYKRNFLDDILLILKLVAIHAIGSFVTGFFVADFLIDIKVEEIIDVKSFLYLFFYQSNEIIGSVAVFRNQGLFWEPGVLSVFLNLLLYCVLFEYYNKKWVLIASLLILSTFSTTGILLLFIQILVYSWSWIKRNVIYLIPASLVVALLLPIVIINASEKFQSDNGSFILRMYDYQVAANMIIASPITGIGFGNMVYKTKQEKFSFFQNSDLTEARGNTNSFVMMLVSFGLPIGIFMLCKFYQQTIFRYKRIFFFVCMICLSSEPLIFTGFFIVLIYSSFFRKGTQILLAHNE